MITTKFLTIVKHNQHNLYLCQQQDSQHQQQPSTTESSIHNNNNRNDHQQIKVKLDDLELWKSFHRLTNEMIVTKNGR